jgi:hypothetical protein
MLGHQRELRLELHFVPRVDDASRNPRPDALHFLERRFRGLHHRGRVAEPFEQPATEDRPHVGRQREQDRRPIGLAQLAVVGAAHNCVAWAQVCTGCHAHGPA